jgi:transcriptional regulator with XRE-family HTH domain
LRRIRVSRGFSQERLAFDAAVDRSYVGGLERAQHNPTIDLLERLAKTLNVSIVEFFVEPTKTAKTPQTLSPGRKSKR